MAARVLMKTPWRARTATLRIVRSIVLAPGLTSPTARIRAARLAPSRAHTLYRLLLSMVARTVLLQLALWMR